MNENFDELLRKQAEKEGTTVPRDFSDRVDEALSRLPAKASPHRGWRPALVAAAAVLAVTVALPNVNAAMAEAMGSLPVLGPLFQAVTFRTSEAQEGRNHVSIEGPQVMDAGEGEGAEEINRQVEAYTDQLIAEYETELHADGYYNLDVTWEVVTDTDNWFTLQLNTDRVMASGIHAERYYHICKATGEQMTLSDLFPEDFDYVTVISEEIQAQMRAQMAADDRAYYWLEGETQLGAYYFDAIDPEQNFYFDGDGKLTIVFEEYEVGPGTMGTPRFTLESAELYDQLLYTP